MKINFVSFSDYSSNIDVYNLEKMDLFAFLLVKIIEKGSEKTIKEVLLDMDITNALLYLYQNNFYYLLDNGLIVNNSDSEDIGEIKVNDLKFSEFGKYCLGINKIPRLEKSEKKRVIYNSLKKELVSENKINNSSNVVVYPLSKDYLELINENKKAIFSRYEDNFALNYSFKEANPYYFEVNVDSSNVDKNVKEYIKQNSVKLSDNKNLNEKNMEFLSSNFKMKLFYGKEDNLVNSDYCLIVDENKKFTSSDNKVYIESIVTDYLDYSFVEIDREVKGYNVSKIIIDDVEGSCFESNKIKDYKGDIKKYLLKNRDKYKNDKIINDIIDLL